MATSQIRPIRVEGNVAFVPLTRGYEAVIDADSAQLVSGHNWFAKTEPQRGGGVYTVYACTSVRKSGGGYAIVQMHRALLAPEADVLVDHVDGNGLNNRKCNLRIASHSQNQYNQRMSRANQSGFKGVSFDRARSAWRAQISVSKKRIHLGYFPTPEAAAAAYALASKTLHGAFGRT